MTTWQHTVLWLNPSRQRVKLSVEFSRCHYSELVKAGWIALEDV